MSGAPPVALLVVGAHRTGLALNHELTDRGARRESVVRTAARYRLYALRTIPAKPGLVRTASGGASIEGELWLLEPAALGDLLAGLPAPMALGAVALEDGRDVVGFLCEPIALDGATEITAHGSWPAYVASRSA